MQNTLLRIEKMFNNFQYYTIPVTRGYYDLWKKLIFRKELQLRINISFDNFSEAHTQENPYTSWWSMALERQERRLNQRTLREQKWKEKAQLSKKFLTKQSRSLASLCAFERDILNQSSREAIYTLEDVLDDKGVCMGRRLVKVSLESLKQKRVKDASGTPAYVIDMHGKKHFLDHLKGRTVVPFKPIQTMPISEADPDNPLLEKVSALPERPVQNTPCQKQKGPERTESITPGRQNRHLGLVRQKPVDQAPCSEPSRFVPLTPAAARLKRAEAFDWRAHNAHYEEMAAAFKMAA